MLYDSLPHAAINDRLAAVVEESAAAPDWYDAWMLLGPDSPEEHRLKVYQAVRDAGSVPEDAGFYLVAWQTDIIVGEIAEIELHHLEERLAETRREHGLDELDLPEELPRKYRQQLDEYQAAWDKLFVEALEEHGETGIADLYRTDRPEFERRCEAGRHWFHGDADLESDDPAWLEDLLELVSGCLKPDALPAALGCRYREEDGLWEVVMFFRPVEIVGGASDGEVVHAGFSLDFDALQSGFDDVDASGWDALGSRGPDGPHVWIEGEFAEREVLLRVLAYSPEDAEPVKIEEARGS
jgi:hypothetical protein